MSTLVSEIFSKARVDLRDPNKVRYSDADMIGYLNDGLVLVAVLKPDSSLVTGPVSLVAGTKQALPAGGLVPLRVGPNISGAGVVGTVPSQARPGVLDGLMPNWHTHAANATVKFAIFSPDLPKIFWCYPAQPANTTQKLDMTYSKIPAKVTAITDSIPLDDEYAPALMDYVMHRAFFRDSADPESLARSQSSLSGFSSKLGIPQAAVKQAVRQQQAQAASQG